MNFPKLYLICSLVYLIPGVLFEFINLDKKVNIQLHDTYFVFYFSHLVIAMGIYFLIIGSAMFLSDRFDISKLKDKTKYRFFVSSFIISFGVYFIWFYLVYNTPDVSENAMATAQFRKYVHVYIKISQLSIYLILILLIIPIMQVIRYLTALLKSKI